MSRRAIRYLGTKSGRHPVVALLVTLVLTVLALWAAVDQLRFEMDVTSLLPEESKMAQVYRKPLSEYYSFGFMYGVFEIRRDAPSWVKDSPTDFLKSVQKELEELRALEDNRFFLDRSWRSHRTELGFGGNDAALAALFTDDDHSQIERLTIGAELDKTLAELSARLASDTTTATLTQIQSDPFGLVGLLDKASDVVGGPLQTSSREEYHISGDGQMMLVDLWPALPATDIRFVPKLKTFLDETREGLFLRHPEWRTALSIDFVGAHIESAEGTASIKKDILLTTAISLASVLILFIAAFRQPEALVFVALPLLVGMVWTVGLASLLVDRITQITLTFAAIMIGSGIDFSIHLYNRYLEDMRLGKPRDESLRNAINHTGPAIVAGALTTGMAFLGMLFSRFIGFRELGQFGGIGIIMSLLATAVVLPALMILFSSFSERVRGPVATFGLKKVTYTVTAFPRITVAASLCLVVYFGIHARHVGFDSEYAALSQRSSSYNSLLDRISEHFYIPTNQVFIMTEAKELDGALEKNDLIFEKVRAAERDEAFVIDSLRHIYPSPKTQLENLRRVLNFSMESFELQLREKLKAYPNLSEQMFARFFVHMREIQEEARIAVEHREPLISWSQVEDPTFRRLVELYAHHLVPATPAEQEAGILPSNAGEGTETYRIITRVYPPAGKWMNQIPQPFIDSLSKDIDPPPLVLGNAVLLEELQTYVLTDLAMVILIVMGFVAIYLVFYFRSFARAGLAMVPVVFALLFMLGAMSFLGMKLNYINIIVVPILVGIGVDSGIHLLGRFYEGERRNLRLAIERTGRAIVITNLTTVVGFGALSAASFQGIREIGILSIIGTMGTMFGSLVFLPAVLRLLDPDLMFKGGAGDEIG